MDWEQRFCPWRPCAGGAWIVKRAFGRRDTWLVTHEGEGSTWTISAPQPICPICSAQLLTPLELEGGIGGDIGEEEGPLFEWARSLAA